MSEGQLAWLGQHSFGRTVKLASMNDKLGMVRL